MRNSPLPMRCTFGDGCARASMSYGIRGRVRDRRRHIGTLLVHGHCYGVRLHQTADSSGTALLRSAADAQSCREDSSGYGDSASTGRS